MALPPPHKQSKKYFLASNQAISSSINHFNCSTSLCNGDIMDKGTCFQCDGPCVSHPNPADHPLPNHSFYCLRCKNDLLKCEGCGRMTPDWWPSLHEIWEDMTQCLCHRYPFCQSCSPVEGNPPIEGHTFEDNTDDDYTNNVDTDDDDTDDDDISFYVLRQQQQ